MLFNLVITIYLAGKKFYPWRFLLVHPFRWHFVPVVEAQATDNKVPEPLKNSISIYTPRINEREDYLTKSLEESLTQVLVTLYRRARVLRFLCFTVGYTQVVKVKEVSDIYGYNYNKKGETIEGAIEKYRRLVNSGYYN